MPTKDVDVDLLMARGMGAGDGQWGAVGRGYVLDPPAVNRHPVLWAGSAGWQASEWHQVPQ